MRLDKPNPRGECREALRISLTKLQNPATCPPQPGGVEMELHVSREARDKYDFDQSLFTSSGNVIFPGFPAVQAFARKMETRAGELNAIGLMDEIFHYVMALYKKQVNPRVMEKAVAWLEKACGPDVLEECLRQFAHQFPPLCLYRKQCRLEEYMAGKTGGVSNRHLLLEEMMMLWISNMNPALETYKQTLFDDKKLAEASQYKKVIKELKLFFHLQPPFGTQRQNLLLMLRAPAISVPQSVSGQLEYIREHWGLLLEQFLARLLTGMDIIKEEEKFGGMGPGETPVYDFSDISLMEDHERFSPDHHWMPRLVMIAKSTYVWLDQLSKKYQTFITRLDQIPDEELDILAERGFTGLWFIGLWERSKASQRIKQICGNPEAMPSAYSIYDYRIADELGGESALNNLKHRAWKRGIRLASDMVPNHMGIDSPWVVEHPDWFLSLDHSPYPSYTFNGPDLSSDPRVGIFLEDHYYDQSDAAVVFKWVNNHSGEVRYIYHGNDGTTMPWNDTAQLNYLNPDVREAVMGQIFSVSHQFPVIRFDAAMTLTRKHYQRLWFPEPGHGGDIPTRAGNGLSKGAFSNRMPDEFWRQVVDRFSEANSDTLLLAEAFWLMEAYFVRTLGMHRVYNSAFMNFLKNEDNAQFRLSIKNVLEFNPQILKRFVNFLNNPDEETAVVQFGRDDKYIGVCTLMATLPGLPMFGHGQVEGFGEKYGMEYRKAYWDETPDLHLIRRHEKEIFPLLRKRYLFADVENFLLYDFYTADGHVNEDVIAFSNRFNGQRVLVAYHNRYATTGGWLKMSAAYKVKTQTGEALCQKSLGDGLGIRRGDGLFTIFRDEAAGLQYIRSNNELLDKGLYTQLEAYKRNIFTDFREVDDTRTEDAVYSRLAHMLDGKGTPNIEDTLRRQFRNPLIGPFRELVSPELYQQLDTAAWEPFSQAQSTPLLEEFEEKASVFFKAVKTLTDGSGDADQAAAGVRLKLERLLSLSSCLTRWQGKINSETETAVCWLLEPFKPYKCVTATVITRALFHYTASLLPNGGSPDTGKKKEPVAPAKGPGERAAQALQLVDDWLLMEPLSHLCTLLELPEDETFRSLRLINVLTRYPDFPALLELKKDINDVLSNNDVQLLMGVNEHEDQVWFHKESYETLLHWFFLLSLLELPLETDSPTAETIEALNRLYAQGKAAQKAGRDAEYRLEQLPAFL